MLYRHTQRGTLIMFLCLVLAAVDAAIAWRTGQLMPVAVLIILVAVAFLFSSLTVEVNGNELRWHFGPGFWTYRLALDEIETVAVVRNHWWNGFGIRTGPGFRLALQRVGPRGGRTAFEVQRYSSHRHRRSAGACGRVESV
jgi:hypothetical protein